uniref:BED-type domain-containing protein n=1 Tax=Ditylenchus dipsaci TaxID=166011 RepID=A0A915EIA2_9BILA
MFYDPAGSVSWQEASLELAIFDECEEEINGKAVAVAHCKFCTQRYRDNATKMTKHFICQNIGQEARKTINMLAGIKQDR